MSNSRMKKTKWMQSESDPRASTILAFILEPLKDIRVENTCSPPNLYTHFHIRTWAIGKLTQLRLYSYV